ncbi:enoyl-CoA hydratase/isomerase family protein [Saccharopolyspora rhizosphaerae]|uniref:Enoyl-CoA hydratase/isomerase family protein n=1 Tax=Saccharopolyspora rhizosphaerae TaxID=2492662 RepID=A0A426K4P2_9PSEU|nr:enoyl-CoA hydratase-related protein [Saccharopolyspora rhizosphaerae]RRO20349.1 enoyl-CoA hydratase/isomerase family protein [Saccharopolyspora rhizosphaerae]
MSDGRLGLEVEQNVARITIDNPGKRNAMNAAMWRRLPELLAEISADPLVRVVVLTGAGDAFCAGADITELHEIEGPRGSATEPAERALLNCPLPTIALINGLCIGGGCQLAAACDLRIAAESAVFGITPAKLGVVYPSSSIERLTELVGPSAAKLLLFSADFFNAGRALGMRLVDEVVSDPAVRVAELAGTIAGRSQLSVRAAKELVDLAALGEPLTDRAAHWHQVAEETGETGEGVSAFLDRRPAEFPYS